MAVARKAVKGGTADEAVPADLEGSQPRLSARWRMLRGKPGQGGGVDSCCNI